MARAFPLRKRSLDHLVNIQSCPLAQLDFGAAVSISPVAIRIMDRVTDHVGEGAFGFGAL
jgi:hypothetical protein